MTSLVRKHFSSSAQNKEVAPWMKGTWSWYHPDYNNDEQNRLRRNAHAWVAQYETPGMFIEDNPFMEPRYPKVPSWDWRSVRGRWLEFSDRNGNPKLFPLRWKYELSPITYHRPPLSVDSLPKVLEVTRKRKTRRGLTDYERAVKLSRASYVKERAFEMALANVALPGDPGWVDSDSPDRGYRSGEGDFDTPGGTDEVDYLVVDTQPMVEEDDDEGYDSNPFDNKQASFDLFYEEYKKVSKSLDAKVVSLSRRKLKKGDNVVEVLNGIYIDCSTLCHYDIFLSSHMSRDERVRDFYEYLDLIFVSPLPYNYRAWMGRLIIPMAEAAVRYLDIYYPIPTFTKLLHAL
jgi:hypothetical protein